jgi:hypothetical protein
MTIVPDMQPALATLVARLLAHDADRRPRSAKSLIVALDAALRAPKRKIRSADLAPEKQPIELSFPPPPRDGAATTHRMRTQTTYSRRMLVALSVGAMMVGAALAMIISNDGSNDGTTRGDAEDTAKVTMDVVSTPLEMSATQVTPAIQPAVTPSLEIQPVLIEPRVVLPAAPPAKVARPPTTANRTQHAHRVRLVRPAASSAAPVDREGIFQMTGPDPLDVATKYSAIGRELQQLQAERGGESTRDLWPSYKRIQLGDAIATPSSREAVEADLDQIQAAITERRTRDSD